MRSVVSPFARVLSVSGIVVATLVVASCIVLVVPTLAATITGNGADNQIQGTVESDLIDGGNGNDTIHGGAGDDELIGGNGLDQLFGEGGRDTLSGGANVDLLDGGDSHDHLSGGPGFDTLIGGAGDDDAAGGAGNDTFDGGPGSDFFDGDNDDDVAHGGPGLDILVADHAEDQLFGEEDSDILLVLTNYGSHVLDGGPGRDVLVGGRGPLNGGDGDDVLFGYGNASIDGGAGTDVCYRKAGLSVTSCETVITLGTSAVVPSLTMLSGPADRSVVHSANQSFTFDAQGARGVWCVTSTGVVSECSDGTFSVAGLPAGDHAVVFVAPADGAKPAAIGIRRFTVAIPDAAPSIDEVASPGPDTLEIHGQNLAAVHRVRARFEDGGVASWLTTDPRVVIDPDPDTSSAAIRIVDPNLGRETVIRVELLDATGTIVGSQDVDVDIESSVELDSALSSAPGALTILGSHFTVLDRIVLVHSGGSLSIQLTDAGVVVGDDQIQITSSALHGLQISQIDAVLAVDGNEVVASLNVEITIAASDDTGPVIVTPGDLVREATSADGAEVEYDVVAIDAVDGDVPVTCDPASTSAFLLGSRIVTCQASDSSGNESVATFTVEVVDTTSPHLDLPEAVTVDATEVNGASVEFETSATDIVDGAVEVTCSPVSGSTFLIGTTIVTCGATDAIGNTASGTFLVVVRDVTPPLLELDGPSTFEISDAAGEPIDFVVRAMDDVDGALDATCDPASGTTLAAGAHAVECEALDAHGNRGTLSFNLTVELVNAYTRVEARLEESLPHVLEERFDPGLPMGAQVGPMGDDRVFLDVDNGAGGVQRIWSEGDFSYIDEAGHVRSIVTQLDPVVDGWSPRSVPYDAVLPTNYSDGLAWRAEGVGVIRALPVATRPTAPAGAVSDSGDRVVYPVVWPSVDLVATALGTGIKEHLIVTSANAPRAIAWSFVLPFGANLRSDENGVSVVLESGVAHRFALPPIARDADQHAVPVWYEASGSLLTLHWLDETDVNGISQPVAYPVDLDPYYTPDVTDEYEDLPASGATSPSGGITADCTSSFFQLRFVGSGKANTPPAVSTARTFYGAGHVPQASVACEVAAPPAGAQWYSLWGNFDWNLQNEEYVTIRDGDLESPKSDKGWLMQGFDQSVGGGKQVGDGMIAWNASQAVGVPNGNVRMFLVKRSEERFAEGTNRRFAWTVTKSFVDDSPPTITVAEPSYESFAARVAPGYREIYATAADDGSGCDDLGIADSIGSVVVYNEPSGARAPEQAPEDVEAFPCEFDGAYDFVPGAYRIDFDIRDAAGNIATRTSRFTVIDPITAPTDASTVNGTAVAVHIEVPQDVSGGSARLEASNGLTTWTIESNLTVGQHSVSWDSTRTQNGPVTLSLVHDVPGEGPVALDEADVTIANTHPLQTSSLANAAQTPINAGFTVLHQGGAVATQIDEISLRGEGGVAWGLSRSYHSQDIRGGELGPGWKLSTEQQIKVGDDLIPVYVDGAGREWAYEPLEGGGYDASIGQLGRLRVNPDPLALLTLPWQVVWPDGRTLSFDAEGRLVREQWPTGHGITFGSWMVQADGTKRKVVSDDAGHTMSLAVNAAGRLTQVRDPLDRVWSYSYDSWGRLQSVSNADGISAQSYEYKSLAPGAVLVRVNLPREASITFGSSDPTPSDGEPFERVSVVTDPSSRDRGFTFEGDEPFETERVTTTLAGRVEVSELDEIGQGVAHTVGGVTQTTVYNDLGQVEEAAVETPNPLDPSAPDVVVQASFSYSDNGVLEEEIDAEDNVTRYEDHDAFGNPRSVFDAEENETTFTYDAIGRRLSETPAEGGTTTWSYTGLDPQPESMDPPAGATINYSYSDTGQRTDESWTDGNGEVHHVERSSYDDAGQLLSTRKGELDPTTFTYDASGRTDAVTDPLGNTTTNEYTPDGLVQRVIDPRTFETSTTYDRSGRPIAVTDALGHSKISEYDAFGNVKRSTDERGHSTIMEYDVHDQLIEETDPIGRVTRYSYDEFGNQVSETDGEDHTITYEFDRNGNESGSLHPGGYTTSTTLTSLQNTRIETDERGYSTTYGYDHAGRETSITNAENETTRTGYDPAGRVEWAENANNERTSYTLDPAGRIIRTTLDGASTESTWDDAGLETTRTDERGLTTELSHDDAGRVLSEQRPDGSQVSYTYDDNGNRLSEENALGEVTRFVYDEVNRLSSKTTPNGVQTTWTYDEAGNVIEQNSSIDGTTSYEYDDANQRLRMITSTGDETTYTYDRRGLLKTESNEARTTEYFYDARGNLNRVESGSSVSTYTHDGTGNVLVHTLPDGSTITYTYDKVGRRTGEVHSVRGESSWTYDAAGRLETETTSAGTTTYTYDARGRVESIAYPAGLAVSFGYDEAGNLLSVSDWSGVRSFTRDEGGRVESFTTVQGKLGTRTYDTAGRLAAQTYQNLRNQLVMQSWTYDEAGRLSAFNTGRGTITYEYHPDSGKLARKTTPDGIVEEFEYDQAGRLWTQQVIGQLKMKYTYDGVNRIKLIEEVDGDGVAVPLHRYFYDDNGRLVGWWYKNDWYRTSYEYTASGNLEAMYRMFGWAPEGTTMPEDNSPIANCISKPNGTAACSSTPVQDIATLSYHVPTPLNPNTLNSTAAQVVKYLTVHRMRIRGFVHDAQDRVTQYRIWNLTSASTGRTWIYDSRGNQLAAPPEAAFPTYDHANRPVALSANSANTWTHDGKLVRSGATTGTVRAVQLYDYDPDGRLIGIGEATISAAGTTVSNTYDLAWDDQGVASVMHTTFFQPRYPVYNHRGDAIAYHYKNLPVSSPVLHFKVVYSPWGEFGNSGNPVTMPTPIEYGGRYGAIAVPGGIWMGARIYDTVLGRFRQVDPLPGQDGLSDTAYSYAANDPVNQKDPTGRDCIIGTVVLYREGKYGLFGRGWGFYKEDTEGFSDIKCNERWKPSSILPLSHKPKWDFGIYEKRDAGSNAKRIYYRKRRHLPNPNSNKVQKKLAGKFKVKCGYSYFSSVTMLWGEGEYTQSSRPLPQVPQEVNSSTLKVSKDCV